MWVNKDDATIQATGAEILEALVTDDDVARVAGNLGSAMKKWRGAPDQALACIACAGILPSVPRLADALEESDLAGPLLAVSILCRLVHECAVGTRPARCRRREICERLT